MLYYTMALWFVPPGFHRILYLKKLWTGPLGLSVRETAIAKCDRDPDSYRACLHHEAKACRFRFVNVGYRY